MIGQLNLPIDIPHLAPRIGMIACFGCGRPISVCFYQTMETFCKQCTAVHHFTWTGTDRMPKFSAIIDVPGNIPKEYLDKLNIPGLNEESEDLGEDPQSS